MLLDEWLGGKLSLYDKGSLFRCTGSCPRHGCCGELVVTISVLEGYVIARQLGRPAPEVFERYFELAPHLDDGLGAARIRFVLKKPCLFLDNADWCSMYGQRPAACALFPEHVSISGQGEVYRTFPCVEEAADLPEPRKLALKSLTALQRAEIYAGEIFLFGFAGFTVDLRHEAARVGQKRAVTCSRSAFSRMY